MEHIRICLDFENEKELKQTISDLYYLHETHNTYYSDLVSNLIYKLEEHL